ncbi:hypothetical protein [Pseudorhodoferax sp. Leaf265]|uniref:hypothetical protein n=1 Tax=Pseudorhodoferax sp. Leaf265 TaxID=1736315 RepID=UPI0007C73303|nr:hypothetical protein [Pseudorhodoferax sp. Leaf265]
MRLVVLGAALGMASLAGCSSMPGEHATHHPQGCSAASAPAGYEQKMKAMQEMHRKMAQATTPGERAALMKDHMLTMQDGMGMMGQMGGGMTGCRGMDSGKGAMPMDPAMVERRMDMMEMMMRMMMDRQEMPPATAR